MTKTSLLTVLVGLVLVSATGYADVLGSPDQAAGTHAGGTAVTTVDLPGTANRALPDTSTDVARPGPALDLNHDLLPDPARQTESIRALDNTMATPLPVGDSGEPYADLWERIRDNFSLTTTDNARVTRNVEWFEGHREYVARLTERGRHYLYFIVDEVEKRGMPSEIALLPIVESAFDPQALSPAKASGMWQFMPETGKLYGLRQNWWYDGRRDVLAATSGALDYLEKLYAQFGAWDLALAAYNCGEGCVQHAIDRNRRAGKPIDYASLALPEETRNYVPKLLAAREIVADPEAHGLELASIPDRPYFTVVTTRRHVDLAIAARFAGVSEAEFLALNPGYSRPVILAQEEQNILVPVDAAEIFKARLSDPAARLVSWRAHHLRRGENLADVASRFGMSSEELKRVNGIAARRRVAGGGTILVRDAQAGEGDLAGLTESGTSEAEMAPPMETITFSHRVRRGESLASIARAYNVSVASLRTWNRISRQHGARLGQLLVMHRTGELGEPDLKKDLGDATVMNSSQGADAASGPASAPGPRLVDVTGDAPPQRAPHAAVSRHGHQKRPGPQTKIPAPDHRKAHTVKTQAKPAHAGGAAGVPARAAPAHPVAQAKPQHPIGATAKIAPGKKTATVH